MRKKLYQFFTRTSAFHCAMKSCLVRIHNVSNSAAIPDCINLRKELPKPKVKFIISFHAKCRHDGICFQNSMPPTSIFHLNALLGERKHLAIAYILYIIFF